MSRRVGWRSCRSNYGESLKQPNNPVLVLGSLAGFTFEKSGETDEALRYYDEALSFSGYGSLTDAVARLAPHSSYRSPRIRALVEKGNGESSPEAPAAPSDDGEVLFVVGYGRVPHKSPEHIPIGLALTLFADALSPGDREARTASPPKASSSGSTSRRSRPDKAITPFRRCGSTTASSSWTRR